MPNTRSISWAAAQRNLRSDRVQYAPGVITAKGLVEGTARIRGVSLLTPTGAFDRAAIMRLAVYAARVRQDAKGGTWAEAMSAALKGAWMAARAARYRAAH